MSVLGFTAIYIVHLLNTCTEIHSIGIQVLRTSILTKLGCVLIVTVWAAQEILGAWPRGILGISSDRDDRRIFWGLNLILGCLIRGYVVVLLRVVSHNVIVLCYHNIIGPEIRHGVVLVLFEALGIFCNWFLIFAPIRSSPSLRRYKYLVALILFFM